MTTMTKEELLHLAIKTAIKAHHKQKDRYGAPYINHVLRVSEYGKTMDEKIVGALHDVVEDNPEFNLNTLSDLGFSEEIVFAVNCLTKDDPEVEYDVLIKKAEQSPLAIAVKINDLRDNMDLRRFPAPLTKNCIKRLTKYNSAYQYLTSTY